MPTPYFPLLDLPLELQSLIIHQSDTKSLAILLQASRTLRSLSLAEIQSRLAPLATPQTSQLSGHSRIMLSTYAPSDHESLISIYETAYLEDEDSKKCENTKRTERTGSTGRTNNSSYPKQPQHLSNLPDPSLYSSFTVGARFRTIPASYIRAPVFAEFPGNQRPSALPEDFTVTVVMDDYTQFAQLVLRVWYAIGSLGDLSVSAGAEGLSDGARRALRRGPGKPSLQLFETAHRIYKAWADDGELHAVQTPNRECIVWYSVIEGAELPIMGPYDEPAVRYHVKVSKLSINKAYLLQRIEKSIPEALILRS